MQVYVTYYILFNNKGKYITFIVTKQNCHMRWSKKNMTIFKKNVTIFKFCHILQREYKKYHINIIINTLQ